MSDDTLLACYSADTDEVTDAVAARLCEVRYGSSPSAAGDRKRHRHRADRQARKVVPRALEYLATVDPEVQGPREAIEAVCEEHVKAALSPLTVWLLGQLIALIVRLVVRWYFSERSLAYRQKAQAQLRSHEQ